MRGRRQASGAQVVLGALRRRPVGQVVDGRVEALHGGRAVRAEDVLLEGAALCGHRVVAALADRAQDLRQPGAGAVEQIGAARGGVGGPELLVGQVLGVGQDVRLEAGHEVGDHRGDVADEDDPPG